MNRLWIGIGIVAVVCWVAALLTAPTGPLGPPLATDGPNQVVIYVPGMT